MSCDRPKGENRCKLIQGPHSVALSRMCGTGINEGKCARAYRCHMVDLIVSPLLLPRDFLVLPERHLMAPA